MNPESSNHVATFANHLFVVLLAAACACTAALVLASFPAGIYTAIFTVLTPGIGPATQFSIFVWLGPLPVTIPFGVAVGVIVVVTTTIYGLLIALAAARGTRAFRAFSDAYKDGFSHLLRSDFVVALVSMGFLVFTVTAIDAFTSAIGVKTGAPSGNDVEVFLGSLIAPLTEEFGFRLCIIGIFALLLTIGTSRRQISSALWRPSSIYEGDETRTGKVLILVFALGISSLAFGVAHLSPGSGWQIGKLPEAVYGGVVLGYLYIRYGFHIAVLAHWGLDFVGSVFAYFGQGVYGISANSFPGFILQELTYFDLIAGIGSLSFILVTYLGLKRVRTMTAKRVSPPRSS